MTVSEPKVKSVHLTLRLDERLADELRRIARLNDRSVSAQTRQFLRDALREYAEAVRCLQRTKAGHPQHPLYVPGDVVPVPYLEVPNA